MNLQTFRPRIDVAGLHPIECLYFQTWGIDNRALVVPPLQEDGKDFLLWHGQFNHFNNDGLAPVFAVPVNSRRIARVNNLLQWVCGVASESAVAGDIDAYVLLDAATLPADNLRAAIGLIARLAPVPESG